MSYRNDRSAGGGYRDYDRPPHGERDRAYDGGRGGGGGGGAAPYDRGLPYRERGGAREPYRAGPGERGPPPPPRRSNSPPPRRGYEQRGPLSGMRGGEYAEAGQGSARSGSAARKQSRTGCVPEIMGRITTCAWRSELGHASDVALLL